jgi:TPR repeat protein
VSEKKGQRGQRVSSVWQKATTPRALSLPPPRRDAIPKVKLPRKLRDLAKTANGGCGEAAWTLARHFFYGTGGVEKNEELERQWLEKGAELGDVNAQVNFGMMLDDEGDYEGARKWWELAAAQGCATAMSNIAQLYSNGEGVEKNESTAAEWFLKAAMKGNHESQFNYGYHLAKNLKQYAEGALWYERSAAQGNVRAMNELGTLYFRGDGVEQNVSKAREMWEKAAANISDEMWEKAAANGNEAAKTNLQALAAEGNADAQQTIAKKKVLEQVVELTGVNISDETFESLVTEPLHSAVGFYKHLALFHKHLALCFLHGTCGLEKNLRMAKEMFKVAEIYDPDDAAVAEELVKLRSCVTCGKLDARWGCKLCRGVRYCDKRCQLRDWHRGIERRPPHRETCSRVVNMFPPGYFAVYRETMAPQRDASN